MSCATVLLVLAAAQGLAPMAEVWPYQAKHQADGRTEYAYDLTAVKRGKGTPDAVAAHGEDQVAAFLKTLPNEVKVRAESGPLVIGAGRGFEPRPLAISFAAVGDGAMSSDNPLAKQGGAHLRAPLHPDQPKVIVGAGEVLWQVRALEEGALAAEELDTEWLRRDLWNRVLEKSVAQVKAGQGDAKEGAIALAARVAAATSCLDRSKAPAAAKADPEVSKAFDAELDRLAADPDALAAPALWTFSPELTCAWVRARVLGQPFDLSRASAAAVLTFLGILDKDPKAKAAWEKVRSRRDRFVGPPAVPEPMLTWRTRAGDVAKSLDSLGEFIDALPPAERVPPPLLARAVTPFNHFLADLTGPERAVAIEELASAVQDGRVAPPTAADAPWPALRDAVLAPLASEPQKGLQLDAAWRDQLLSAFAALQGGHHDVRPVSRDPETDSAEPSELSVRLMIPPVLEVEPVAFAYERAAVSLEQLQAALTAENLTGLKSFGPDGRRGTDTVVTEAKHWVPILRGLARLAVEPMTDAKDVGAARAFLAGWRSEPGLTRDVRGAFAAPFAMGGQRAHAAIAGVGRRELTAVFASPPKAEVVGAWVKPDGGRGPGGLELYGLAEQRYIVPVMVTVQATSPATARPLDRPSLKAAFDSVQREPARVEGAFAEALHK